LIKQEKADDVVEDNPITSLLSRRWDTIEQLVSDLNNIAEGLGFCVPNTGYCRVYGGI